MADRTATVYLKAVTTQYQRAMQDATKATDSLIDKAGGLEAIGGKMQAVGSKMTRGLTLPLAAGMGLAVKSASDLQQAVGGTEAVFGGVADEIDRYAESSARAMGLSEREFREATTSIGGQLKRMTGDVNLAADRSVELTQVAADLAATYGGTTAEAVAALGSAFRGEADPAERFNLNLKIGAVNAKAVAMGLAESEQQVSDSARAQATYALIMEQSADAQGQFARESDSAAGSMQIARAEMENASAEIGAALLPLVADLAGGIADLARGFTNLPEPIQNGILAIGGLLAVTGPVLSMGGKLVSNWQAIGRGFDKAATGAFDAAGKIGTLGRAVGGLAVGVGAIWAIKEGLDALGLSAKGLEVDIQGAARATTDELLAAFLQAKDFGHGLDLDYFTELAEGSIGTATRLRDALAATGEETSELDAILRDVADGERQAAEDGEAAADALGDMGDAAGDSEKPMANWRDTVKTAADEAKLLEERIRDVESAIRSQLDPIFKTQDAFKRHKDAQDKVKAAQLEALVAQQKLDTAIKEHGRKSDEAALASLELAAAQQRVKDANSETARTALDVAGASVELRRRIEEGTVKIDEAEEQLRLWVEQGLMTEEQAFQVAEELRGVASEADRLDDRNIRTTLTLDAQQFWMELAAARYALADTQVQAQLGGARTAGPQLASGGPIPGPKGAAVPITAHGGEFVLSADVVDAIKNGRPTSGLPALAAAGGSGPAAGGSSVTNYNLNVPAEAARNLSERTLRRELASMQYLTGAR